MNDDRTVHGRRTDGAPIVRYDRSGKWYIEPGGKRRKVSVNEAAQEAVKGFVYFGRPGGQVFDARVRALREAVL